MKGIDNIFCASQASTAICLSMQQQQPDHQASSSSSSSTFHLGGRAIDRHNPIIRDGRRVLTRAPCSSDPPPINPKPYHQLPKPNTIKKNKKSFSSKSKPILSEQTNNIPPSTSTSTSTTTTVNDVTIYKDCYTAMPPDTKKKSSVPLHHQQQQQQQGHYNLTTTTPPGSSRYLLSDAAFFDGLSDYDPVLSLVYPDHHTNNNIKTLPLTNSGLQSSASKSPDSSSSPSEKPTPNVVVLRVSLHCKGCEGKVRKHLSRMKGVTSFNIDFAAKKVTVVGDVTPLSVLASISKVKTAKFWPAAAPPTSTSSVSESSASITATVLGNNNKLEISRK